MGEVLAGIGAYWLKGGWLLVPIAGVSFAIWGYGLRLRRFLRGAVESSLTAERHLDAWLSGRSGRGELMQQMTASGAMIPCQLADVLRASSSGREARRRFETFSQGPWESARRDMLILKALTAAAPLLGLLGTVTGMVETFTAVSRHGAEGAALVAQGISSALITTQFGLVAALPGVFGLLHLSRLRTQLTSTLSAIGMMLYVAADRREASPC